MHLTLYIRRTMRMWIFHGRYSVPTSESYFFYLFPSRNITEIWLDPIQTNSKNGPTTDSSLLRILFFSPSWNVQIWKRFRVPPTVSLPRTGFECLPNKYLIFLSWSALTLMRIDEITVDIKSFLFFCEKNNKTLQLPQSNQWKCRI